MGSLIDFNTNCKNIQQLKDEHGSTIFIETGCFRGNSLGSVIDMNFQQFYSCDIDPEMVEYCTNKFSDKPLDILLMSSPIFLEHILPNLNEHQSIMFYLDAHLTNHDKTSGAVLTDNDLNFPLEEELFIINRLRPHKNDVVIIDDLRIYEHGSYEGGNWEKRHMFNLNLDFISQYGYHINKFYSQEGYILLRKLFKI